jgi:hypothetical protein
MKTLIITKKDLDADNYYVGDKNEFDGHIELEANLGWVRFKRSLKATGKIVAEAGTGIEAGWGIKAGTGIEAGWGIEAGTGIKARLRIFAGLCLGRKIGGSEK